MNQIDRDRALIDLKRIWGYDSLRPKQREVIEMMNKTDSLIALLPTGGGKSLCYQLSALQLPGLTVVISPLISLMEDQITGLKSKGINAATIHSGHRYRDIDRILDNCKYGNVKLLYVAPERLETETFIQRMSQLSISLLAVDEAHCISQWGHDFRPSYRRINAFIQGQKPDRVMALTGTANQDTLEDIAHQLGINPKDVVRDSFLRSNIHLSVIKDDDKLNIILAKVKETRLKSIIYTRSRRRVEMISAFLKSHKLDAAYYHAGLSYKAKKEIQDDFRKSKIRIVAATNAFGMGIDMPDVDQVIHYDAPPSLEDYYQEVGRAGRSQQESQAIMIYADSDIANQDNRLITEYPSLEELYVTYSKLHRHYGHMLNEGTGRKYGVEIPRLAKLLKMAPRSLYAHLKALQKLSLINISDNLKEEHRIKYSVSIQTLREVKLDKLAKEVLDGLLRSYTYSREEWIMLHFNNNFDDKERLLSGLATLSKQNLLKHYQLPVGPMISFIEGRYNQRDFLRKRVKYDQIKDLKTNRWISIKKFINHTECRNQYILRYFDQECDQVCNNCDICDGEKEVYSKAELINMSTDELRLIVKESYLNKATLQLNLIQSLIEEKLIPATILPL